MPTTGSHDCPLHLPEKMLVIGASARYCANGLSRMGIECVALDYFSDWDLAQVAHTSNIGAIQPSDISDLLVALDLPSGHFLICGGMEKRIELLEQIGERLRLIGTTPKNIARTNDPFEIQSFSESNSIRFPEIVSKPQGIALSDDWLVKPLLSAGGTQIKKWEMPDSEMDPSLDRSGFYWQKQIRGQSFSSVFCCSDLGTELIGSTEQLVGRPEFGISSKSFVYCGSIGPVQFNELKTAEIEKIGSAVAREFGLSGVFGIDWVLDNSNQNWLIEINPRITASCELFELAGVCANIVEVQVRAVLGWPWPAFTSPQGIYGKAILYNPHSMFSVDKDLFQYFLGASLLLLGKPARSNAEFRFADIPTIGTEIRSGSPVVSAFVSGATRSEVFSGLAALSDSLATRTKKLEANKLRV